MLLLGILTLTCVLSLMPKRISNISFNRIGLIIILFCFILSLNSINEGFISHSNTGIYNGLWQISLLNKTFYTFIYFISILVLLFLENRIFLQIPSGSEDLSGEIKENNIQNEISVYNTKTKTENEYSLFILLNCLGMISLISSFDLISFFLAIELQSFSLYIISTIYKNSESSTSAGLKYFLLGALSSGFILLGSSLLYGMTGITHFDSFNMLYFSENQIQIPLFILLTGLLFKISAAPFHNWSPDVYDGVPTIVTSWIAILPKISIIVFLMTFVPIWGENWNYFILISATLSLIIGSILGLGQYRIKRLLAYSAISHIGFILLSLNSASNLSFESTIFYLMQYSLINVNIFCFLTIFNSKANSETGIQFLSELKGFFKEHPLLGFSFALCLFSMAGIPPCIGFFAKLEILNLTIKNGLYFISFIAILTSVIGTVYYLRIIQYIHFYSDSSIKSATTDQLVSKVLIEKQNAVQYINTTNGNYIYIHSLILSIITLLSILFLLDYTLVFNFIQLLQLNTFGLNQNIFY